MTVEEVAGLPTCKYSERVQSLKLPNEDLAFLKGLRRRIKNRVGTTLTFTPTQMDACNTRLITHAYLMFKYFRT